MQSEKWRTEFDAEFDGNVEPWNFGVPVFGWLEPLVKLALLADVAWALLHPTDQFLPLTAVDESVVGAIIRHIEQSIGYEIDCHEEMDEGSTSWRQLILNVFHEIEDTDDLRDVNSLEFEDSDFPLQVF